MNGNQKKTGPKRNSRDIFMVLIVIFIMAGIMLAIFNSSSKPKEFSYNEFVESLEDIQKMEAIKWY